MLDWRNFTALRCNTVIEIHNYETCMKKWLIPVAVWSKAWVCTHSLAGIVGLNPTRGMDVCVLWMLCIVMSRFLHRADHLSRGVLPTVICLSVIMKSHYFGGPGPPGSVVPQEEEGLKYLKKWKCTGFSSVTVIIIIENLVTFFSS